MLYDKDLYENYPSYLMDKKKEKKKENEMGYGAPSPIPTLGNQQEYGTDYWRTSTMFKPSSDNTRKAMDIQYDGQFLTANAYDISEEGDTITQKSFKRKAYSGRPENGKFDYSVKNQATRGSGPLPEGSYYINPQKIQRYNPSVLENTIDHIGGALGQIHPKLKRGTRPGGTTSWGNGLIDIYPNEVEVDYNGKKIKRDKFTIHGGTESGSAGCIDLLDNDEEFFDFIDTNKGNLDSVALKVDYSQFK